MKLFIILAIGIWTFFSCKSQPANKNYEFNNIENSLLPPVWIEGTPLKKMNLYDRMNFFHVPGISITIIKNGKITTTKNYGVTDSASFSKVNSSTLFQAGSISKAVTAVGIMTMVENEKIHLDSPIQQYIKDWQLPQNRFTHQNNITTRQLLSHSAGINLGAFIGYTNTDSLPDLLAILNGEKPANTPPVALDTFQGVTWKYSGGGFMILQKVLEEQTGMDIHSYCLKNIFSKVGMSHSFFTVPLPNNLINVAKSHDRLGAIVNNGWIHYPELAAAGLWSTSNDLAKLGLDLMMDGIKILIQKYFPAKPQIQCSPCKKSPQDLDGF